MVLSHGSTLSERVIGLAMDVDGQPGLGLLESLYEECLCCELEQAGLACRRQVPLPIVHKTVRLECGYRMDIVIEQQLIVEIKSVEKVLPIHEAQMLTYLRLSGCKIGLLTNFNSVTPKDGLRRVVL